MVKAIVDDERDTGPAGGSADEMESKGSGITFSAEFAGAPINRDGILRLRLSAPYSETGAVARLILFQTKGEQPVSVASKKRRVEGSFVVDKVTFKGDGSSTVELLAEASKMGDRLATLAAMRNRSLTVVVGK